MRKSYKSVENQHELIRTEKIAREVRQRSLQNAGIAPRPPRGPPGAPGGRFINTRAFINRRSLVPCIVATRALDRVPLNRVKDPAES